MYTVYAFGNGYLLSNMFMAIAAFFANGGIYALLNALILLSYIFLIMRVVVTGSHFHLKTMFMYTGGFAVVYLALISVQVNVNVQDVSNPGSSTNAQVISNVPIGIALPWSYMTTVQYVLASKLQDAFSIPAGDNLIENGIGLSLYNQEINSSILSSNSYLYEDYNMYIQNCILVGVASGNLSANILTSAGDATDSASQLYNSNNSLSLWNVMLGYTGGAGSNILTNWYSGTNASSLTEQASGQSDPQGTTTTCGQEGQWLNTAVAEYTNTTQENEIIGQAMLGGAAQFTAATGATNPFLYNIQQTGQQLMTQAIAVNMFSPAVQNAAKVAGANGTAVASAVGIANDNAGSNMFVSGIMAEEYMPVIFAIFETVVLGLSSILLILAITHLGFHMLKTMLSLLITAMIWPSIMVVYNYISQLIIQAGFTGAAGLGYSIGSHTIISTQLMNYGEYIGFLSWSIPIMAYGIATGSSYAMVSAIGGSIQSAVSGGASAGAQALGSGNVTAGVISDNMYSANKTDSSVTDISGLNPQQQRAGYKDIYSTPGGPTVTTTNVPGLENNSRIVGSGTGTFDDHKMQVKESFENGKVTGFQSPNAQAGLTTSVLAGVSKNFSTAKSQAQTASTTFNAAVTNAKNFSNSVGSNITGSKRTEYDAISTKSFDSVVDNNTGLTATQQNELKTAFSLNLAAGENPITAGFSASQSVLKSNTLKSSIDTKFANAMRANFSKKGSLSFVAQGTQGTQLVTALNDVETSGKSYQEAVNNVKTAQTQLNFAENNQAFVTDNAWVGYMNNYNSGFSGADTAEKKRLDMAEYNRLQNNPSDLESFVAENSAIIATENKINAGAGGIPTLSSSAVKAGINSYYTSNQPGYTPIAGTPTPASAKAEIKTEETPKKSLLGPNADLENKLVVPHGNIVENFFATGFKDLALLGEDVMTGKSFKPITWNPGKFNAYDEKVFQGYTPSAMEYNAQANLFNSNLTSEKNGITDSLLPGASGLAAGYLANYENNALTNAGNNLVNENSYLNPASAPEPTSSTVAEPSGNTGGMKRN